MHPTDLFIGSRAMIERDKHHLASICSIFMRPDIPLFIEIADFRHPNRSATSAPSSALALPSTGGDFSFACQWPPSLICSSELVRAFGLTFTRIVLVLLMVVSNKPIVSVWARNKIQAKVIRRSSVSGKGYSMCLAVALAMASPQYRATTFSD